MRPCLIGAPRKSLTLNFAKGAKFRMGHPAGPKKPDTLEGVAYYLFVAKMDWWR